MPTLTETALPPNLTVRVDGSKTTIEERVDRNRFLLNAAMGIIFILCVISLALVPILLPIFSKQPFDALFVLGCWIATAAICAATLKFRDRLAGLFESSWRTEINHAMAELTTSGVGPLSRPIRIPLKAIAGASVIPRQDYGEWQEAPRAILTLISGETIPLQQIAPAATFDSKVEAQARLAEAIAAAVRRSMDL